MITVLCLSPSMDHTLDIPHFTLGATNRASGSRMLPRGKGINVALALHALGQPVHLVTPLHEEGSEALAEALRESGLAYSAPPAREGCASI